MKENKKLRKKLAKQQQEFNNYREELANQVGEELAKQREELAKQREELAKQREELAKQREELAKQREELAKQREEFNNFRLDMDELRGNLGCGPPLKQEVKTEAEFLNGHEFGSASGEIVNALIKKGTTEQGGGCERFHCVCGGNVKNEKRAIYAHNRQPMHTKYVSKKEKE